MQFEVPITLSLPEIKAINERAFFERFLGGGCGVWIDLSERIQAAAGKTEKPRPRLKLRKRAG